VAAEAAAAAAAAGILAAAERAKSGVADRGRKRDDNGLIAD